MRDIQLEPFWICGAHSTRAILSQMSLRFYGLWTLVCTWAVPMGVSKVGAGENHPKYGKKNQSGMALYSMLHLTTFWKNGSL